ncbi:GGDEF domain-containing protein [Deinococcus planocerae]|uniref:GGDEF domain-containing protein n=1 Tax=Deinococcus planocerae TaxID=1737569 RepID=UPI000C7E97BE|nr:GGDEF domain-containing protein [Deinococcus planocerae]
MLPAAAPATPRDRLLRLGWRPAWALLPFSAALHLLDGNLTGLWGDALYAGIVLLSAWLGRRRPEWGLVCFYAALPPLLAWLSGGQGLGRGLSPDLTGYSAALILPALTGALYFRFRGVLLFLLYALGVGGLALPVGAAHLSGAAWNVLLALGLGGQTAWLVRGADRAVAGLRRSAFVDPLTGLANRRAFDTALDEAWAGARADLAVVLLDLDGLKGVNDGRGHAAGDELLRGFAAALGTRLGPGETAYRLGGDEYAVLCGVGRVRAVQGAVRGAVIEVQQSGFLEIGASVGSAEAAEAGSSGALVRLADERMYTEKRGKPQRRTQLPV